MKTDLPYVPDTFETERLVIRMARPGDGAAFNQAIVESLPDLKPWLAWTREPPTLEHSESVCRGAWERFQTREDMMVFFFLKETGEMVGGSGLHEPDWDFRRFEVGYWGRSKFSGTGLMAEGVRAVAEFAAGQLQARRIFLTTDDRNVRSWRLAERAGFRLEGLMKAERFDMQGNVRDTRMYAWPV